ncbi:MAG: DUF2252 domain-containing protein [Acidobacteriaceae bacterium]
MTVAKLLPVQKFDLGGTLEPWDQRRAEGKALRRKAPLDSHAAYMPAKDRPDPLKLLAKSNSGRQKHLIPLRMGRMASSPFAFLRGSACVMASDLSKLPISGVPVIIDGDAHINNFGMYGTPQREVVFDLNDFDEATVGPWEWDLKRMVASLNVAGRQNGLNRRERAAAVKQGVEGYRFNASRLQNMGVLDVWYLHSYPGRDNPLVKVDPKSKAVISKTMNKALRTDNRALLPKVADRIGDRNWTFRNDPPVLTTISKETKTRLTEALNRYAANIGPERRAMLARYHIADIAHRVVGIGSVGTRAYLVLLFGINDDDPLFLQVKECVRPAHGPYLPPLSREYGNDGLRVVVGQRALQASSDPMLGYTEMDGRNYLVRQMKNLKASVPIEFLTGASFNFYAWACGAILARAHSRTGDPARIAGYCGNSEALDDALAQWAEHYGDQTEEDHAALLAAIKRGDVKTTIETDEGN